MLGAGTMIAKVNFPKVALVIAAAGQGVVGFLIHGALVVLLFVYYGIVPGPLAFLGALCSLLPLFLLMLGLGLFLALTAVVVRDVGNALGLLLMGLMLLTPVLYPVAPASFLGELNAFNPLRYLVAMPRDLLLESDALDFQGYWVSTALSLLCFLFAARLFYVGQCKIAERM